jgi:hypothetical protein
MKNGAWMVWTALVLLGCEEDPPAGNAGGAGGMAGVGAGGMAGAAGSAGGAAGTTGGAGGTGMAGGGAEFAGCSAADTSAAPSALHAAALAVLTTPSPCNPDQACPCGSSSCHGGRGKAELVMVGVTDLTTLVGNTSCQAPNLPLVASGGTDTALAGSWLWLKMTQPVDSSGTIAANAAWGQPGPCDRMSPATQPYGVRMPWSGGRTPLPESRLAPIRNWICAGAPGP